MITAYIKPTNYCPVACNHCYLPKNVRDNKQIMSFDIFEKIVVFIKDWLSAINQTKVHIIWHGGEPLTVEVDWYKKAISILKDQLPDFSESMQTSLMTLKNEHIEFIKDRFNSKIGSSIDFSSRTINGSSQKYIDKWMGKVKLLNHNSIGVVPIIVPSKKEIGSEKAIVDWFMANNFKEFRIERYISFDGKEDDQRPDNYDFSLFLINLFNYIMYLLENGSMPPKISIITAGINLAVHNIPGDRWASDCMSSVVVFEPDGSTNNCTDKANLEQSFSNVNEGFKAFYESAKRRKWIRISKSERTMNVCNSCRYYTVCSTGCPLTIAYENNECSGYKIFLDYVNKYYSENKELVDKYLTLKT